MSHWFVPPGQLAARYVADHEKIELEQAPDLRVWVLTHSLDLVVALVVVVIMLAADDPLVSTLGSLGLAVITVSFLWRLLQQAFTRYVLTDYRAIRISGVLRRDYEWISWRKVTDVSVQRSFFDRCFGTATIDIQSANEASGFKEMTDVPNPTDFEERIVELAQGTERPSRPPAVKREPRHH